jgi:uncharacterized protein YggE
MQKNWLFVAIASSVLLSTSMPTWADYAPSHSHKTHNSHKTIQVMGTAAVTASPDELAFSIHIERRGAEPSLLESQVSSIAANVVQILKSAGVKADNIESMQLTLYPQHRYDKGERVATEFVLGRSIEVTHNDFNVYATLLTEIIEAGATNVSQAHLQVSDAGSDYQKALQLAMQNAQSKAQSMLSVMGQKVGDVLSVTEVSQPHYSPQPRLEMLRADKAGLNHPGQAHTSARVNVTFAIAN